MSHRSNYVCDRGMLLLYPSVRIHKSFLRCVYIKLPGPTLIIVNYQRGELQYEPQPINFSLRPCGSSDFLVPPGVPLFISFSTASTFIGTSEVALFIHWSDVISLSLISQRHLSGIRRLSC